MFNKVEPALQAELNEKLGFESRGVKFANFQVLRETTDYMPSILLELGFVSNEDEQGYLLKPESLNAVALVIWECLIKNIDSYERVGDWGCKMFEKSNSFYFEFYSVFIEKMSYC